MQTQDFKLFRSGSSQAPCLSCIKMRECSNQDPCRRRDCREIGGCNVIEVDPIGSEAGAGQCPTRNSPAYATYYAARHRMTLRSPILRQPRRSRTPPVQPCPYLLPACPLPGWFSWSAPPEFARSCPPPWLGVSLAQGFANGAGRFCERGSDSSHAPDALRNAPPVHWSI